MQSVKLCRHMMPCRWLCTSQYSSVSRHDAGQAPHAKCMVCTALKLVQRWPCVVHRR